MRTASCWIIARLSQEDFGKLVNYSGSHISAVETGTRPPTSEYAAALDRALDTGGLFDRLFERLSALDAAPVWLREWITFEEQATALRWYEPAFVPGLLQTEAYARAVLRAGGQLIEEQIGRGARSRLQRQAILDRAEPPLINRRRQRKDLDRVLSPGRFEGRSLLR